MAGDPKDRLGRFARRKAPEPERAPEAAEAEEQDLGGELDFGLESSPERVATMQRQLGNQAVLEVVEEAPAEEAHDIELEPEHDGRRGEASTPGARTGLPPVHDGGGGGADWDLQWGDDGDPEDDPPVPPPRRRPSRRRRALGPAGKDAEARQEDRDSSAPRVVGDRDPAGGAWRWIAVPAEAADPSPAPEGLVGLPRLHPLSRCRAAGHFLAGAAAEPLARALAGLAGPLPGGPGLAGLVARAAAVVSAAEAIEAGSPEGRAGVARAISLALEDDARDRVDALAPRVAREQRLAAHLIFDACAEDELPDSPKPAVSARPDLAEAALRAVARPWPIHDPPRYAECSPAERVTDPALAALDAILRAGTGGAAPRAASRPLLEGMQQGAWTLLDQTGGAQRELAAAGLAAWRIAGAADRRRIRAVLAAADRSLRGLARSIYAAGRRIGELEGAPLERARRSLDAAGEALYDGAHRVRRLRDAALSALARIAAGSGDAALSQRHAVPSPSRVALHRRPARPARSEDRPLIGACAAVRGGDLEAAMPILEAATEADGPAGMAAGVLLSGALLARHRHDRALPVALSVAERCYGLGEWPLFSAAMLDVARGLELSEGVETAREALGAALGRMADPGVLLRARLLELG